MNTIAFSDILIKSNRQRQEFDLDALQELKNSIEDVGLMHPPVLRQEIQADGVIAWYLVAGERRLRAIKEILELGGAFHHNGDVIDSLDTIPFIDIGELDELQAEEAELDENIKRKDLTWQETASAQSRLHTLRSKQNVAAGKADQTYADTAQEVLGKSDGYFQDVIRTNILVAKHLDRPEVAAAKTPKEALKILKAAEQREKNIELAREVGKSFSSSSHTVLQGSCLELLASGQYDEAFDVICTDPPYGMGADQFGDGAGKYTAIDHKYDDSEESWRKLITAWAPLSYRVAKPQAHLYAFCDIDRFHEFKAILQAAGWEVFRTPFTLVKPGGRVPLPERGPRRTTEWIIFANKGRKPCTHIYPDSFSCPADENLTHGAQKPIAVMQNLLIRSVQPGDKVLDSFAGTGPTIVAGHMLQCYVTAIEQDPAYFAISQQRLVKIAEDEKFLKVV